MRTSPLAPSDTMPRLVRLYPGPWRARYGEEFVALLEARPPNLRDRVDIVRGAIDARINKLGESRPPRVVQTADRLLALGAVAVGALLSMWTGILAVAAPRWGQMDSVDNEVLAASSAAGLFGGLLAIGVLIGIARRHEEDLGPVGVIGAGTAAVGFLATNGASALGVLLILVGMLLMGAGLARAFGLFVAAFIVGSTLLLVTAMVGFVASNGQEPLWIWMAVAFGPSWVVLGVRLLRGARIRPRTAAAT